MSVVELKTTTANFISNHCRVFYEYKEQFREWFAIIYLTGQEAVKSGYYFALACDWFNSKQDAVTWGKQVIDRYRDN
ncbi:MAG TPA: hypothetical protein DDZ80_27415 [Cyanobacteria bacterium UBA8803]|nr:hypothetical protein [Cyanobacteria bacterium UBA8803]